MAIHQSIRELIGNTPLVQLNRYAAKRGLGANILAKIEYFNPAGSVKDRVGFAMLDAAEKAGKLNRETVIIEPTSGNTGIAFSEFTETEGSYMFLAFQVIVDTFAEGTGTFSVNDPYGTEMCKRCIIQILIQFGNRLNLTQGSLGQILHCHTGAGSP